MWQCWKHGEMARITGHSIKTPRCGGTGKDGDGQHLGKAGGKSTLSDGGSSDVYAWEEPERYYLCKWRRVLFYDAGGKYAGVGGL